MFSESRCYDNYGYDTLGYINFKRCNVATKLTFAKNSYRNPSEGKPETVGEASTGATAYMRDNGPGRGCAA